MEKAASISKNIIICLFQNCVCAKPSSTLFPWKKLPPWFEGFFSSKKEWSKNGVFWVCSNWNFALTGNPVSDGCLYISHGDMSLAHIIIIIIEWQQMSLKWCFLLMKFKFYTKWCKTRLCFTKAKLRILFDVEAIYPFSDVCTSLSIF